MKKHPSSEDLGVKLELTAHQTETSLSAMTFAHLCQLQKKITLLLPVSIQTTNKPERNSESPAAHSDSDLDAQDLSHTIRGELHFLFKKKREGERERKKKGFHTQAAAHCTTDPARRLFDSSLSPSHRAYLQTTWASAVAVIWHTPSLHTPTSGGGGGRWEGRKEEGSEWEREGGRNLHYSEGGGDYSLPYPSSHCRRSYMPTCVCARACSPKHMHICVRHVTSSRSLHFNSENAGVRKIEGERERQDHWRKVEALEQHLVSQAAVKGEWRGWWGVHFSRLSLPVPPETPCHLAS